MNFDIPQDIADYLKELDDFIEREIRPLELEDDYEPPQFDADSLRKRFGVGFNSEAPLNGASSPLGSTAVGIFAAPSRVITFRIVERVNRPLP